MQKFVKFRFTLSALSAMEFIFVMLSEPPCRFGYNKAAVFLVLRVKVLNMTALCILTHHDGTKTIISLKGKEYHANKLQYVLSRIADRSVYKSVDVVSVDPLTVQLALKVDALEVI